MPMDGLTAGFAARELNSLLEGGRVDKITQPEKDTIVLVIRAGGENRRLLLCASPNNARCHLTRETFSNPLEPPVLCMLMRKQLQGARVESVRQVDGDRIIHVDFDAVNEMGDHVRRRVVLEIMGRHSNLLLLDENSRILEAARHVNMEMSRVRQIQPGMTYLPPPSQDKLDPNAPDADALLARISACPPGNLAKVLGNCVTGLSHASAEEAALPAGGWPICSPGCPAWRIRGCCAGKTERRRTFSRFPTCPAAWRPRRPIRRSAKRWKITSASGTRRTA